MFLRLFLILILVFNILPVSAQINSDSGLVIVGNVTIEDIINAPVNIASKNVMRLRESPGIITVITEEEIRNLGARDLMDILNFVPGLCFGSDIQGYAGLGVRGNWASEGKVSIFVDGIEINELLFANMPFGNHFSVDNIRKIEIIRGPGSSMYGGTSELAVIRITTKQAEQEGIQVSAKYGQMKNGFGRANGTITMGKTFKNLKLHLGFYYGDANRGDGIQKDAYYNSTGISYPMIGNSLIKNRVLNGGLEYKNFKINFLVDHYNAMMRDGLGYSGSGYGFFPKAIDSYFNTSAVNVKYDFKLSKKLRLTPTYQFRHSKPWSTPDTIFLHTYYGGRTVDRHLLKLELAYDVNDKIDVLVGSQYFTDHANAKLYEPDSSKSAGFPPDHKYSVTYKNISAYTQAVFKTKVVNITIGARYDRHSAGYDAFVPRLAITRAFDRLHFKFLAAQAFRAPYISNISNDHIKAEKADIVEAEIGYWIFSNLFMTVNIFKIDIHDVLIYSSTTDDGNGGYVNSKRTGTLGLEASLKYKDAWGYVDVNYSYYRPSGNSMVPAFQVNKDWFQNPMSSSPNAFLAFAPHKINMIVNFTLSKNINWNVNCNFVSKRYGYNLINASDSTGYIEEFKPQALLNTYLKYDNIILKGLSLGVGCSNIFNEEVVYITPYNSFTGGVNPVNNVPYNLNRAPMPGPSREFYIGVMYTIR